MPDTYVAKVKSHNCEIHTGELHQTVRSRAPNVLRCLEEWKKSGDSFKKKQSILYEGNQ